MRIEVYGVEGIPLVKPGTDLGEVIAGLVPSLQDTDILVIASSVVSKAEDNLISMDDIKPSKRAKEIGTAIGKDPRFVEAVLSESKEVLIDYPFLLVETGRGHICINAGIDASNIEDGMLILLPRNPDASAKRLREEILQRTGKRIGVVISDTCGRPFREGQTGVAVGCSGVPPFKDWRGIEDLFGKVLEVTIEAVADEIAGFANLIMGEGNDGVPAVVISGLCMTREGERGERESGAKPLFRIKENDRIRKAIRRT